eukprot:m.242987 g.242987  ORF g.242987 m.242987 type:complete len:301 (-) comp17457_c1_seq5:3213-4115(-)
MMFATSTHKQHWLLSSEELASRREKTNAKACALYKTFKLPHFSSYVSSADEQLAAHYYAQTLFPAIQNCVRPALNNDVTLLASTYFLRYSTVSSLMEHFPELIAIVCFLTAVKVAELRLPINTLCAGALKLPNTRYLNKFSVDELVQRVRLLEPDLHQKLKFHFVVHLPLRPLKGLWLALHNAESTPVPPELLEAACQLSRTSMVLTHPPSQIALAAVLKVQGVEAVLPLLKDSTAQSEALLARLQSVLEQANAWTVTADAGEAVADKLAGCINPYLDVTTEEYKQLQRQKAKRKQAKTA